MPITSPTQLEAFLIKEGYAPEVSSDSVFVAIGGSSAPYTAAFTFTREGHLQITCQLALLGEFPEEHLAELSLAALDGNMQISPYAFAIIGASQGNEVDVEKCPLVLIDTIPTADLNEAELKFALDRLLQALTFSASILKMGLSPVGAQ